MFAHLFDAWLGFDVNIDKIVSNDTEVVVFCTITADSGLSGSAVHHFVARDGLEVSFDLF